MTEDCKKSFFFCDDGFDDRLIMTMFGSEISKENGCIFADEYDD